MICIACPKCATALEFGDELAGADRACYACRQTLKVPAAPIQTVRVEEPPAPPSAASGSEAFTADNWRSRVSLVNAENAPSPVSERRRQPAQSSFVVGPRFWRIGLALAVVLAGIIFVFLSGRNIWIYCDNGGKVPIVVTVEGAETVVIAPGAFEKIVCEPGERRIRVLRGDQVLFDEVKDLRKSDKLGVNRSYVLNPDNNNRYRTYTIQYGSNFLEGLLNLNDKEIVAGDRNTRVRDAYQQLAALPELLPADAWFEPLAVDLVLTSPPTMIRTKRSGEKRTALTRVDAKDYAVIEAARKNQTPTEDDLKALAEVIERVFDDDP